MPTRYDIAHRIPTIISRVSRSLTKATLGGMLALSLQASPALGDVQATSKGSTTAQPVVASTGANVALAEPARVREQVSVPATVRTTTDIRYSGPNKSVTRTLPGNDQSSVVPGLRACPAIDLSLANQFDAIAANSTVTLQLGAIELEGFASTYTLAATDFPLEITSVESFFASIADVDTSTAWLLQVYDGLPTTGTLVFQINSDPDPAGSGQPGDILIAAANPTCNNNTTSAIAAKLRFSVDPGADVADKIRVLNINGTNRFTVVLRVIKANQAAGNCVTLPRCKNAFLCTEGDTINGQANVLNFPDDNWLFAVPCPFSCPAGFTRFSALGSGCSPTRDFLLKATYVSDNCVPQITGACCATSGTCTVITSQACTQQGGTYRGDNVTCANAACPQPPGACCLPIGGCDQRTNTACVNIGGIWRGANSVCGNVTCSDPSGACCLGSFCAAPLSLSTCTSLGGSFAGNGTACTAGGACPLGGCCFSNGTCAGALSSPQCLVQGGVPQPVLSVCANISCPLPSGACCSTTGTCTSVTQAVCLGFGGTWQGAGAACTTTLCAPPTGACCTTTNTCVILSQANCIGFNGSWKGANSPCTPTPCVVPGVCCRGVVCSTSITQANCTGANTVWTSGSATCNVTTNSKMPCCRADFNKTANVTVQDIFDFLAAWFAGSTTADYTGNGAARPAVQSIFDFLSAWFRGPC